VSAIQNSSRRAVAALAIVLAVGTGAALAACTAMGATTAAIQGANPTASPITRLGQHLTAADGFSPDGSSFSPFAETPAIGNLEPGLREEVRHAALGARSAGIEMVVNTGWRSERYQQKLLDDAVVTYGSEEEALRWVSSPRDSMHVTGRAVDIGPTDADSWLSQHGADYGLCQTLANEMWHFELATSPGGVCTQQRSDAAAG